MQSRDEKDKRRYTRAVQTKNADVLLRVEKRSRMSGTEGGRRRRKKMEVQVLTKETWPTGTGALQKLGPNPEK